MDWGLWALLPLGVTLLLAFVFRSALIGMLAGASIGTLMAGSAPGVGLNELFQSALGNGDFVWICEIVILIGVLFELFRRAGVLGALAERFSVRSASRRGVALTAWGMGFVIVDDYFSPLLTGAVIRPMSDRASIPREKLAFILDSTTASVCILVPFTAWGAYVAGLIAAQGGAVASVDEGLRVFIAAIPWNFYPILLILFTLLIAAGLVPDFGPMRRAERRAAETGQLLRSGARPLLSEEAGDLAPVSADRRPLLLLELFVPVLLLIAVATWSIVATGAVRIVEAFMLADAWLIAVLAMRGDFQRVTDVGELIVAGAGNVMGALLIVALAYALNSVTRELGAGQVVVEYFSADLRPNVLVVLTFLVTAALSFSTGTSWGAFALMMPVALPVAYSLTGDALAPLVYQTVAAVLGGGIFGDHASPVSDTTVLSSLGAGSDHIDHVVTQLPYALVVAAVTVVGYLLV
jgi:Na+/H+ antiporter NhaC